MKKNLVMAMVVSGVIVSSMVSGCGNKEAVPSSVGTTQVVTERETTVAETKEEVDEATNLAENNGDYLSWTGKEWKNASDDEKENAAKAYLIESMNIAAKAAGQDLGSAAEAAATPEAISATVTTLDAAFAADESIKLQEMLDMAANATNMMMESAMQQTP